MSIAAVYRHGDNRITKGSAWPASIPTPAGGGGSLLTASGDFIWRRIAHLSGIVPSGFSSDEDDEDEEPTQETETSPEEVLQYAWETVCYVIWGKASAKGGQKVVETAPEELKEQYRQVFA